MNSLEVSTAKDYKNDENFLDEKKRKNEICRKEKRTSKSYIDVVGGATVKVLTEKGTVSIWSEAVGEKVKKKEYKCFANILKVFIEKESKRMKIFQFMDTGNKNWKKRILTKNLNQKECLIECKDSLIFPGSRRKRREFLMELV